MMSLVSKNTHKLCKLHPCKLRSNSALNKVTLNYYIYIIHNLVSCIQPLLSPKILQLAWSECTVNCGSVKSSKILNHPNKPGIIAYRVRVCSFLHQYQACLVLEFFHLLFLLYLLQLFHPHQYEIILQGEIPLPLLQILQQNPQILLQVPQKISFLEIYQNFHQ